MKSSVITTEPATEPVTLAEAQACLRVDSTDDETRIEELIGIARKYVEEFTGRAIISQAWKQTMPTWPSGRVIELDYPPLASVESVKYYPASGAAQATLSAAAYIAPAGRTPGVIELKYDQAWPDLYDRIDAVEVNYTSGAASAAAVSKTIKQAVYMALTHFYENTAPVNIGDINGELDHALTNLLQMNRAGGHFG